MPEAMPARLQKAKRSLTKKLAGAQGFVGAGVTTDASGGYEFVVLVVHRTSPVLLQVPAEWEGVPVRTEVSGAPRKFRG